MTAPLIIRPLLLAGMLTLAAASAPRALAAQDQPIASDVKAYLRQFVNKLREFRVGSDEVDWGQVESKALAAAAGAQTITDAHPGIRAALVEIRDPWAVYRSASGQVVGPDQPRCVRTTATAPSVPADVGYLKATPTPNRGIRAEREAAVAVRTKLKSGDDNGAVHWIIDLRGYFMGTLPAAVIGLSPIMGDGTVFKMQYANNVVPFNANESSIKSNGDELQIDLGRFKLSSQKRRIAVLVDGGTAGVGELLAIAFMGRSNTRVFGTPTCGIPPMRLVPQKLKDGAEFSLSAFRVQDRDGRVYRGPIEPTERIEGESELFSRALAWVSTGK
ncbi:S41 family peptidase [Gemmatimonas sp.]|uniref:S41 family peptidase n=1 Tax=Gemmatimonas sp. TaxID=1962908 RepID=UPI00286E7EF3|nr:S41 family peptidase [Gemmatimonas sp.]